MHNRKDLVRFTLESLRAQHHPGVHLQIVVVDDGSTDGGPDMVEAEFGSVRLLRQTRQGAPAARNRGIAAAAGYTTLLLDSDDLVEPGYFLPRLAALAEFPDAAGAYGPWEVFESDSEFAPSDIRPRHSRYPVERRVEADDHLRRLLRGWYIPGPAVLWRTAVLRRVNGHDERLHINQDVDMMFRILLSTAGIVGTDGPCALTRNHEGARQGAVTSSERVRQILELRRRFRRDLENAGRLDTSMRQALAEYAFDGWAAWRSIAPASAKELLSLSRELWPELGIRGGWVIRALGAILGPANATMLKQRIQRLRLPVAEHT